MQQNWHSSLNWPHANWKKYKCLIVKLGKLSRTQQNVSTVNQGYIIDTFCKCNVMYFDTTNLHFQIR